MNKNTQNGFINVLAIIIVLVAIVGISIYFFGKQSTGTFENSGYRYSLDLPQSKAYTYNDISGLVTTNGDVSISVSPSKSNTELKCTTKVAKVADIEIAGSSHPLCQSGKSPLYITNFKDTDQWHNVVVLSPTDKPIAMSLITSALNSLTVVKN